MSSAQTSSPDRPLPATATKPGGTGAESPSGAGPGDVHEFLLHFVARRCTELGAVAGAIYFAGTESRRPGIAVSYIAGEHPSLAPGRGGLTANDLADPALLARMERTGAAAVAELPSSRPATATEEVTLGASKAMYAAGATHRVLGVALIADGRTEGATVLVLPVAAPVREASERVAVANAEFEAFLWRRQCMGETAQKIKLRETLELLDSAQQGHDADAMAAILCHELRRRFGCSRVSIGMLRQDRMRIIAISGADDLDKRGPAAEPIEAAMEECAGQDAEVQFPAPAESEQRPELRRVTRDHQELDRRFGPSCILSLPLRVEGDLAGVVTLERDKASPFPPGAVSLLRLAAEFFGPSLYTRRLADRSLWEVVRDKTLDFGSLLVGPRHTGAKLLAALVLLVLLLLAAVPIPDHITAKAEIRAARSRTVVPPFTGYLATVDVRTGDKVEPGTLLATMDTTDLNLELAKARAQRSTLESQRDEAQAKGEVFKVRGFEAEISEADAQIAELQDKLGRARITAPISGIVSRGDLDPYIGARIDPSQPLLEIVTPDRIAVVSVSERDAHRVQKGMTGTLATRALPGRKLAITVLDINPSAEVVDGANVYLAEVSIAAEGATHGSAPWLSPGMSGNARLRDGWTTGLVSLARPLVDELRLRTWW